jgi:hypothetical protein
MKSSINNQACAFHQGHHLLIIEARHNNLQSASAQHVNQNDDLNSSLPWATGINAVCVGSMSNTPKA